MKRYRALAIVIPAVSLLVAGCGDGRRPGGGLGRVADIAVLGEGCSAQNTQYERKQKGMPAAAYHVEHHS